MTTTRQSGEFERVDWLRATLGRAASPLLVGPGDDAAAWIPPRGRVVVTTVDTQQEGVHFRRSWISMRDLGQRALAAAASDLAAMAADPGGVLLALTLPPEVTTADFRTLFRGFAAAADAAGLRVFGGNLSRGPLGITTTAIGHAPRSRLKRRDAARPGDLVWVTGWPGRSRVGLALLEAECAPRNAFERACLAAYRRPRARLDEALALARGAAIRAMIDISDGLAQDLGHVLQASFGSRRVGAVLERAAIAGLLGDAKGTRGSRGTTPSVDRACARLGLEAVATTLCGGEDFELLFTTAARERLRVERVTRRLDVPVRLIGKLERGLRGVHLAGSDGVRLPWRGPRGHDHFSRSDDAPAR